MTVRVATLAEALDTMTLRLRESLEAHERTRQALGEVLGLFINPATITDLEDGTVIGLTFSGPTLGQLKTWRAVLERVEVAPPACAPPEYPAAGRPASGEKSAVLRCTCAHNCDSPACEHAPGCVIQAPPATTAGEGPRP